MRCMRNVACLLIGAALLVARSAAAQADPGATGPHAVTVAEYGSYTTSISLGNIPTIEVRAEVRYPTDLVNGPYPLIVMLHGRHPTCYAASGEGGYAWPCPAGQTPIPNYKGYDYAAAVLASHGIIVVSVSANGINAKDDDVPYLGADERSALIQYHLDKWRTFSTTGGSPFANTFVGRVDLTRVGTMGHSRGGEGVIWHYNRNLALGSPYGIRAVLPVQPTATSGAVANNVPVGVMLGYCDGDVYTLDGRSYLDDSRYNVSPDNAPKYTFLALGANHNYFNRYWTPDQYQFATNDDGSRWGGFCDPSVPGNGRLTSAQQRGFGLAYMAAFFRRYLFDANEFDGILRGDAPPPPSAQTTAVYNAYFPGSSDRKDVNRLTAVSELTTNTIAGGVTQSGFSAYGICGDGVGGYCWLSRGGPPPDGEGYDRVSSLLLWWTALGATYTNQIPITVPRDLSNFRTLQFRVALNFNDPHNPAGQDQDFTVRITDGAGATSSLVASTYEKVYFPPDSAVGVLNTARFPMSAFTGADITNIASVEFVFDRKAQGAIVVSDVAFADEGISIAEMSAVSNLL